MWSENLANKIGWRGKIAQINHTYTNIAGTIRGMHYQNYPYCEVKMISCIRGAIWDVAVDIRKESPTYLKWYAEEISAKNGRALLLPEGVAHGYQALTDNVELIYFHSKPYMPGYEAGMHPMDPKLSIQWPLKNNSISTKDMGHAFINNNFEGIKI